MAYRFLRTLRRWARIPRALSILGLAIGFIVAGSVVVIACCDAIVVPPSDGMMGADHKPIHLATTVPGTHGKQYKYVVDPSTKPNYLIKRNGAPWITVSVTSGVVSISDPNGVPGVVVIKTVAKGH